MSIEPQEYIDDLTGPRLTVERDIPECPRITVFPPEGYEVEEINEAIRRLLQRARKQEEGEQEA